MKTISALLVYLLKSPYAAAGYIVAAVCALTIAGAWFFQLVLGVLPCPLCLYERIPYYVGIPLAIILAFLGTDPRRSTLARLLLLLLAAIFIFATGLGAYHAGMEWGFWQGPTSCSGAQLPRNSGDLLSAMNRTQVVPCDKVQWSFLGISLAGYNALISVALATIALGAALFGERLVGTFALGQKQT